MTALLEPVRDLLARGGPVTAILLALSVAATTVVIAKLVQFRRARLGAEAAAVAAAEAFRRDAPARPDPRHPAGELVALALAAREAPPEALRDELTRAGRARLAALRAHLRLLEVVAGLAPLLGLFGTVIGMIDAFRALERAGGAVDPAALSGGIWTALLTTAVGLAVAMPAVAAHGWLDRRVERAAEAMDDVLARLLTPPLVPGRADAARAAA